MITTWREFNRTCCFRIGGVVYPISVTNLIIKQVPAIPGGGESFFTDISRRRRSTIEEKEVYYDGELSWDELGDDAEDYEDLINALFAAVNAETIDFCRTYPFDADYAVLDVIPIFDDEVRREIWESQIRVRPAKLKFLQSSPNTLDYVPPEPEPVDVDTLSLDSADLGSSDFGELTLELDSVVYP